MFFCDGEVVPSKLFLERLGEKYFFYSFGPFSILHFGPSRHHHKNTGNIDKDEIFYPVRARDDDRCDYSKNGKRFIPLFGFGLSWFFYLVKGKGLSFISVRI